MKRSLDIPYALYEKLQAIAEKKNISVAAIIKMACSEYLERQQQDKK